MLDHELLDYALSSTFIVIPVMVDMIHWLVVSYSY